MSATSSQETVTLSPAISTLRPSGDLGAAAIASFASWCVALKPLIRNPTSLSSRAVVLVHPFVPAITPRIARPVGVSLNIGPPESPGQGDSVSVATICE